MFVFAQHVRFFRGMIGGPTIEEILTSYVVLWLHVDDEFWFLIVEAIFLNRWHVNVCVRELQALDLIAPIYRVMDTYVGVRERTLVLFASGILQMKQQNLQEARYAISWTSHI